MDCVKKISRLLVKSYNSLVEVAQCIIYGFLWWASTQLAWSICTRSLYEGGVGLRDLHELCDAATVMRFYRKVTKEEFISLEEQKKQLDLLSMADA